MEHVQNIMTGWMTHIVFMSLCGKIVCTKREIVCSRLLCRPYGWKLNQRCPGISIWLGDRILCHWSAPDGLVLLLELPLFQRARRSPQNNKGSA